MSTATARSPWMSPRTGSRRAARAPGAASWVWVAVAAPAPDPSSPPGAGDRAPTGVDTDAVNGSTTPPGGVRPGARVAWEAGAVLNGR